MKALGKAGGLGRPGLGGGRRGVGMCLWEHAESGKVFLGSSGAGFPCARIHVHLHACRQSHRYLLSTLYSLLGDEGATAYRTQPLNSELS